MTLEGNWSTTVNAPITATYDFATINLSGTWTNNAPITATGYSDTINLSGTWTNNAPITATDYDDGINLSGTWTNNAPITATPYAPYSTATLSGTWTNNGTITVTGTFDLSGTWTNNGTIAASSSNFDLAGTWTNNGTITADASSEVTLGNDSSAVSGPGDIWKSLGTLAIAPGARHLPGRLLHHGRVRERLPAASAARSRPVPVHGLLQIGILGTTAPADNPITRGTGALNCLDLAHCTSATTTVTPPVFVAGKAAWPV